MQHLLSQLRKGEEEKHNKTSLSSSLIRFYGHPILPPLLSQEQREEMQQHRSAAQKAAAHRKSKADPRMACVQAILHSVQLRKTPTLEELLQEPQINTKSSYSRNTSSGAVSQSNFTAGTKDNLSLLPPPVRKRKDGVSLFPLTSTTNSAFVTSNVTPQQSYQEGCLTDQQDSQQESQPSSVNGPSHQSVSSGYMTYENVDNATGVSGSTDLGRKSHGFGSSEGVYNTGGFFLLNTSSTISKMPDIINHPPMDGEELERSGLEKTFCSNFLTVKDISGTSFQQDSVICDHSLGGKSESSNLDSTGDKDNHPYATVLGLDKNHSADRIEIPVSLLESRPELSQTLSTDHCLTTELHIQYNPTEAEPADYHADEAELSEQPYRLSLQSLQKKSQEYRWHQRMLRNQAKNSKIQEKTQEQPRARAEEQSLSDKENDEFPYKRTVTAEGKKTKEGRGTFIPTMETSPKKSWGNDRIIESELIGKRANVKSGSMHLTEDGNTKQMTSVQEETMFQNNKLNSSHDVIAEPKQISAFIQQHPMSKETSTVQEAFYSSTGPSAVGKYHSIPAPNFCRSPVRCKSKGTIKGGEVADGVKTKEGTFVVKAGLNEEQSNMGHHRAVPFTVNLMVEGDVTNGLAKSSQHIDQLESSLSSLKILISDLESTVKENLGNHSQTETSMQSELSFKGIGDCQQIENDKHMQLCQGDCDCWENELRGDGNDAECSGGLRRQSLHNCKNTHEDAGPEPGFDDTDDVPLIAQRKGTETAELSKLRTVKILTIESQKDQGTGKEGLTKMYGCRKQQPSAKCIRSVAQQMRIPDVFRNAPSETKAPCSASVLVDTSNHHDSTHSPSLNQSYDVDTPSDLWLLEGSGSDLGSKGHLVQEKDLTPESGGEGQGGLSKVKRRLVMHVAQETQERSADVSRGVGSVVRPSSSTPRAAVWRYEDHGSPKGKRERLQQAHAAQIRALQDEHRRQQEELLQALAVRYRLLQSVSFPCSSSASRPGDTLTFSTLSQPSGPLSECYRPLLSAAVKGFLTRRLLRTERVVQLVRTIRDTQQFLQAFQQQSPSRGAFCSRQDLLLQERVTLQLRAARYEVYDIFFSLSARERMQLISWDRELARERALRRQSGHTGHLRGKSSLSAATQKSLERKRAMLIQKKATERPRGVVIKTAHKTGFSAERLLETKHGRFRTNPQSNPKSTHSTRPR